MKTTIFLIVLYLVFGFFACMRDERELQLPVYRAAGVTAQLNHMGLKEAPNTIVSKCNE